MNNTAIYAGSFDPPTLGHVWVIKQAAQIFDRLIVAIGVNPEKKYTFTVKERTEMLKEIAHDVGGADWRRISIVDYTNKFLVRFCEELQDVKYIVRGIRNTDDCKAELAMLRINLKIARINLTTIFLGPPPELSDVSSSMVKGMCGPEGWEDIVHEFVPAVSFNALRRWKNGV